MAAAAQRRHQPALAGAEWPEATLLTRGTLLQHETDTSGGAPSSGSASWKSAYIKATAPVPWQLGCSFCNVCEATLAAHVSSVNHSGLFLVPCCSSCNSNPSKKLRKQAIVRDVLAQPVPQQETDRVVAEQKRQAEHESESAGLCSSAHCANKVCAKGDCGGSSVRYCCAHCKCKKCTDRRRSEASAPDASPEPDVQKASPAPAVSQRNHAWLRPPEAKVADVPHRWDCASCGIKPVEREEAVCETCEPWMHVRHYPPAPDQFVSDFERLTRFLLSLPDLVRYSVENIKDGDTDCVQVHVTLAMDPEPSK